MEVIYFTTLEIDISYAKEKELWINSYYLLNTCFKLSIIIRFLRINASTSNQHTDAKTATMNNEESVPEIDWFTNQQTPMIGIARNNRFMKARIGIL